jgi:hypothetical protein
LVDKKSYPKIAGTSTSAITRLCFTVTVALSCRLVEMIPTGVTVSPFPNIRLPLAGSSFGLLLAGIEKYLEGCNTDNVEPVSIKAFMDTPAMSILTKRPSLSSVTPRTLR